MPQNLTYEITDAVITTWITTNNGGVDAIIGSAGTIMLASAPTVDVDITLPAASENEDRVVVVKKTDATANLVRVVPDGSDKIDGATEYVLSVQYQAVTLASNGANWFIV